MTDPTLPGLTLRHVLEQSATLFADKPALSNLGDVPLTYGDFYESVKILSHWLSEQGIGFGDTVAILAENCPHWGIAYFAVTSMGAVAVPILTEFHSDAIAHIIRHSEAKAVFVSERFFSKVADASFVPSPLFINLETFTPISQGMTSDTLRDLKSKGLREFRKWKEKAMRLAQQVPAEPAEDDLAAIIYTSGTTGHSKGVQLTHRNIVFNASAVHTMVQFSSGDRLLSVLPLAHTFECTLGLVLPVLRGAQIFYLDKPPTGRVLLPALAQVKPTAMLAVPLIMEKIFKTNVLPKLTGNWFLRRMYGIPLVRRIMNRAAGKKLLATFGGALRVVAIGGAPLAADAERFLREAKFPFAIGYGLTETSPMLTGTAPDDTQAFSSGRPLEGVFLRLANINPQTGEGEIQAKGPNIMRGYFKLPEVTSDVFTDDGWLRTGDLGIIDAKGYVYIKGRSKNVVIGPSGENIYPEEIESFFFASPSVLEVLVYQHAGKLTARVHLDSHKVDELLGDLPAREAKEKRLALLEEIRAGVNSKVSSFARIVRIIEQPEPFEKTPTQKIKRYLYIDS